MKSGAVVQIRLSPADVMACIDLVRASGAYTQGMSLSQCVKLALAGLCQGMRNVGHIPTRDGFEYAEMIAPFTLQRQAVKVSVTRALEGNAARRQAFDIPNPQEEKIASRTVDPAIRARKTRRMHELGAKRAADPINFGPEEQAELDTLTSELIVGYT